MKTCSKCGSSGPFNKNKRSRDGLSSYCTACMKLADQQSYVRHKDERLKKSADWRKQNPLKVKERKRAWEKANPDKLRAMYKRQRPKRRVAARLRYAKDSSKFKAGHIRWKNAHPEREKAVRMRRRARKRNAAGVAVGFQIEARIAFFGGLCAYCQLAPYEHVDHTIPLSCGGTNWPANLRPSCAKCNLKKGTKVWKFVDFGEPVEGYEPLPATFMRIKNIIKNEPKIPFNYAFFEERQRIYFDWHS